MSEEIIFSGTDNDLILEVVVNEYGWTPCYLSKGRERIFLGAECIGYIVTRLQEGLNEQSPNSEMSIEAEKTHWVLSLSERNHVLYATFGKPKKKLFWQDADGESPKISGMITLECEHRERWLRQLASLEEEWGNTPQWNYR